MLYDAQGPAVRGSRLALLGARSKRHDRCHGPAGSVAAVALINIATASSIDLALLLSSSGNISDKIGRPEILLEDKYSNFSVRASSSHHIQSRRPRKCR